MAPNKKRIKKKYHKNIFLFAGIFAKPYLSLLHQLTNQQEYHPTVQHIAQQSIPQSFTFIHAKLNMGSTLIKVYAFTVFSVTLYACRCMHVVIVKV